MDFSKKKPKPNYFPTKPVPTQIQPVNKLYW